MKKIISSVILSAVVFISLIGLNYFTTKEVKAQNIGTLQSIVTPGFSFKKDLILGDTDPDIRQLQKVLNADIDTMIISDDVGSRGKETTYFGPITKAAVIKFQNKYKSTVLDLNGITVADGKVNKATRTRLNLLIGVMNTYDSIGLPQSRASTAVVVPPAPVIAPTPTQSSMSICNFINILVSINVVTLERANSARSTMGCAVSSTFVDLKVNGSNGPITVPQNSSVTLSWTTGGMVSCVTGSTNKTLSGSEVITLGTTNRSITLTCRTATGSNVSDSITVNISGNGPILLSTGGYDFGYTTALFSINTNVPTKSYITYWTINKSDAKTASFTSLKSSRAEAITGLTPDTTYHFTIKIVDANGNDFTSPEYTARTSNSPVDDDETPTASTTPSNGKMALSLSGKMGDYVAIANSTSTALDGQITLEAWVKPTAWVPANNETEGISTIVVKGQIAESWDYWFGIDNGKIYYSSGNNEPTRTCSPVVPLNQWSHVAVSIDEASSTIAMYLNGTKVNSLCGGLTGVINKSSKNLYIGNIYPKWCNATWYNFGFNGLIDDVRIWDKARTAQQIASSTNTISTTTVSTTSTTTATSSLMARWTFDSGYATDVTNHGNDGSTTGVNTGTVEGEAIIVDAPDSPSGIFVGSSSYNYTYVEDAICEPGEEEEEEIPSKYGASFGGYVFEIEKCADSSNNYYQVIIKPCKGETSIVSDVTNNPNNPSDAPVKSASEYSVQAKGSLVALFYPGYGDTMPKVGDSILGTADTNGEAKCQTVSMKADGVSASVLGKSIGIITESGVGGKSCAPKGSGDICNNLFESIGDWFDHANCKGGFRFW